MSEPTHEEKPDGKKVSGYIDLRWPASRLTDAMSSMMSSAGLQGNRFTNWIADPVAGTVTLSAPKEVG